MFDSAREWLKKCLKRSLSLFIGWLCRIILSLWDEPLAREKLGELYSFLRESEKHYSYSIAVSKKNYQIHPTATWHSGTMVAGDGMISIGEKTYIGRNSSVIAHPACVKITIGRFCAISHNVDIRTEGYRTDIHFTDARLSDGDYADITIGDFVWIGANAFICPGITIGENSVIGANSVVTHDVPPNAIYGGIPAKLIRYKIDLEKQSDD